MYAEKSQKKKKNTKKNLRYPSTKRDQCRSDWIASLLGKRTKYNSTDHKFKLQLTKVDAAHISLSKKFRFPYI